MKLAELEAEALKLDPQDRARLAERLLGSLEELPEAEVEALWLDEAERRDREVTEGRLKLIPGDEVLAELKSRFK
jgi:putative addiction module component (TIGR02574 family)